jgi:putative endonuclease
MNHHLYILYSSGLDKFYIGSTSMTVEERLKKHNTNHKGFTGNANDRIIAYVEDFTTKELAMRREQEIKKWKSKNAIMQMIKTAGS